MKNEFTTGNRNIKNAFNCNQTAFACCENIAECSRTQREVSIMLAALLAAAEARTPQFAVIEQEWKISCWMAASIKNELHCDIIAEELSEMRNN